MPTKQVSAGGLLSLVKLYLFPLVIGALIVFSALLFVSPRLREISDFKREVAKKEKQLSQLTVKSNYLEGLNQQDLRNRANYLLKVLPDKKEVSYVIKMFKKLASENDLVLANISTNPGLLDAGEKSKKSGLSYLEFDLSLSGRLSNLREFFARVNQTVPLLIAEDLSFSGGKALSDQEAEVAIRIKTPYLFLPKEMGAVETALEEITSGDDLTYRKIGNLKEVEMRGLFDLKVPSGKTNPFAY